LGPIGSWFDRSHERLRWSPRFRNIVPALDNIAGLPFRSVVPKVEVGTWAGSEQVSWSRDIPDLYALQRWKVLASLSQALTEADWDVVYFTTASSYLRVNALLERVDALPNSGVFAGTRLVEGSTREEFASGANRAMSRDVVEAVIHHRRAYSNDVMEDVGLSRLIGSLGVELIPWPSMNIESEQALNDVSDDEIRLHHHFRLRSELKGVRQDVSLMKHLHQRVREIGAS
jgi:hypothetical protein